VPFAQSLSAYKDSAATDLSTFLCGIFSVYVYGGRKLVKHGLLAILIIGTAMAGTQYFLSVSGMWTLGGFGASLAGLFSGLAVAKLKNIALMLTLAIPGLRL
jgi:hypothetical protein